MADGVIEAWALFSSIDDLPTDGQYNAGVPEGLTTPPAYAKLVAGIDPTQAEEPALVPLEVDGNGRLIPLVPTESTGFIVVDNEAEVIAAPASGAYYLFGWDVQGTDSQIVFLSRSTSNADIFSGIYCVAGELMSSPPLGPMRITTAIYKIDDASSVGDYLILRYAIGP